jgi:hypothetical protein
MGRMSLVVISVTLLLACSASFGAAAPPPPTRTYAVPCPPSELLRRHDALLVLAAQVRADLGDPQDTDVPSGVAAVRQRNTTLFQIAVLERDTAAAHRALEGVRGTYDTPAAGAMSGLFTEPYLETQVSLASDFHAAYRERLTRRLAALPFGDVQFTLVAVRGQMAAASPDVSVGTAQAALDPLVQDGRITAGHAATLIALAVNDELVRSAREDLLACLDAAFEAHRNDSTPFSPRVGVVQPPVRGAWFGQKPPGRTPVRFAPAILDSVNRWCNGIAFSPDGNECFLGIGGATYGGMRIVHATCEAGVWTPFTPPAFLSGFISTGEPHFSPDGGTLFFTGKHPGEFGRLWAVTRTGAKWGKPERQPTPIEGEGDAYRGRRTDDGTWYFGLQTQGMVQIYRTTTGGAGGVAIEKLGAPVNQQAYDGDPCVAPDGRWLVFNSARILAGRSDLYVSFADGRGNWGTPVHLGPEYNTPDDEFGAMLSPDGMHLFFTRHAIAGNELHWVDAAAIDALKPAVRE